jgi:hypothetical protein
VLDADARRARRASRAARVLHPVTPGQPHGAGVRLEPQPLGRQVGARAATLQQAAVQRFFQRAHPPRDRRLRDPQPLRRPVEAARVAKVEKGFDLFDVHARAS